MQPLLTHTSNTLVMAPLMTHKSLSARACAYPRAATPIATLDSFTHVCNTGLQQTKGERLACCALMTCQVTMHTYTKHTTQTSVLLQQHTGVTSHLPAQAGHGG